MNATRNKRAGRKYQAKVANLLNGKNVGTLGGEDVEHALFSYETKRRKAFVACAWMDQARRNCPEGKIAIVVCHVTGQRHEEDLVVLTLRDWIDLHGGTHERPGTTQAPE